MNTAAKDPLFEPNSSSEKADELTRPNLSYSKDVLSRLQKNPVAIFSIASLALLLFFAILGPSLNHYSYYETMLEKKNTKPGFEFWFGSDDLGRDLFTRTCYGARISLFVGFAAAFIDLIIGVIYGASAALLGRRYDEIMMRFADTLYAIPNLLIIISLMVVIGSGIVPIILCLTISGWINMARIVRAQVIQLKELEYVLAAKALGASFPRILFHHILPNVLSSVVVTVTLTIPSAIFIESFLSFLGLGVQAPIASWGTMASDGLSALKYYPWRIFFPAAFISWTMLCFNLLGDALRDALDPKLRK